MALTTYWLSLNSWTTLGDLRASRPAMTAMISMRLLVVLCSAPLSSRTLPVAGCLRMQAQPPGPGLPMQAPSV